jgi:hypothetical protein
MTATLLLCFALGTERAAGANPPSAPSPASSAVNTFTVVMQAPPEGAVAYLRHRPPAGTDRVLGRAFSLGRDTYVTAAHVLLAAIGSQYGPPQLRAADGSLHRIDQVLKFSLREDFLVFTLEDDPAPVGLEVSPDPLSAATGAESERVAIAPRPPGDQGAPVLDAEGRVRGIYLGTPPGREGTYALALRGVLDTSDHRAHLDADLEVGLPHLQGTQHYSHHQYFDLPRPWSVFAHLYQQLTSLERERSHDALLNKRRGTLFPTGPGSQSLLFHPDANGFRPRLIVEGSDGAWRALAPDYRRTDLGHGGSVSVASAIGVTVLQVVRPVGSPDAAFYSDAKSFMDLALRGFELSRIVDGAPWRIASLGAGEDGGLYVDHYGRKWQQHTWPVPVLDEYVVGMLLPTPDGYAALMQIVPSAAEDEATERAQILADQIDVSYAGTLAEWRDFLTRRALLPTALGDLELESSPAWTLRTQRFAMVVPPALLRLTDASRLALTMGYLAVGRRARWEAEEYAWYPDARQQSSLELWRRARPSGGAGPDVIDRFEALLARRPPYDGLVHGEGSQSVVTQLVEPTAAAHIAATADVAYGLSFRTGDRTLLRNLSGLQQRLRGSVQLLEGAAP